MTDSRGKEYDWAFDLRAFNCDSSDDDPEDDVVPRKQIEVPLQDFDLGLREESVSYKPNPFSIAKINAAYRSARNGGSEPKGAAKRRNGLPVKASGLMLPNIDDALKRQESKNRKAALNSCTHPEANVVHAKQPRVKANHPFVRPQRNQNSNLNPDLKSSAVCSGFDPSLVSSYLSENTHTVALPRIHAASVEAQLCEEPVCTIPSDNGDLRPKATDWKSPSRDFSLHSSPIQSTISKFEVSNIFPKHESSPIPLSAPRSVPTFVESSPIDNPGAQRCFVDPQVKQGSFKQLLDLFRFVSQISPFHLKFQLQDGVTFVLRSHPKIDRQPPPFQVLKDKTRTRSHLLCIQHLTPVIFAGLLYFPGCQLRRGKSWVNRYEQVPPYPSNVVQEMRTASLLRTPMKTGVHYQLGKSRKSS